MFGKRYWKIEGYDGTDKTFEKLIPEGFLNESEVVVLLQRLSARHLDENEIVSSSLRPPAPGYAPNLEPQFDEELGGEHRRTIRVGSNAYYVAGIWHREELSP